ncbi:peptidoglycan DD-metalloendopeptidase family protein [Micromonospora sp. LH3U1]|uniref:peptidoglycan DD-metalloendopeptidase family protein n=1 Tax=Micromonospora sp. LH3U1 TaxID=3018339 RepID=UPI002349F6ED|nr:peptidoglycan DD-metalloendopeptidase family protein [Micromonospora sp. LH3U1]WCN79349.1 peptidoglycan DD-metalloendopeptidase family protein [Micromonospora sp. LH3U1]
MNHDHLPACCGSDGERPQAGLSRRRLLRGTALTTGALAVGGVVGLPGIAHAAPAIYNPFAGYRITGTWQDHLNSGSLGGIDFGMGVGTNLPACGSGTIQNIPNNGTGGHTVTIHHVDGYRSQYLHLSQFLLANGTAVGAGAIVGRSGGAVGAPGSGSSTGPHLHWHMINPSGVRINPLTYIGQNPGGGGLPKTSTEQDGIPGAIFYKRMQNWLRITSGYTGPIDGVPGVGTYAALQQRMRDYGYTGPIDGAPGTNTWKAVQRLASGWGYTGPIDGVMGPNSWRGFARFLNQNQWN